MLVFLWLYYGKFYILGAICVTYMLNKVFRRFVIAPLIINMVSVLCLLLIPKADRMYAIYYNYLPVVITSMLMNALLWLMRLRDGRSMIQVMPDVSIDRSESLDETIG